MSKVFNTDENSPYSIIQGIGCFPMFLLLLAIFLFLFMFLPVDGSNLLSEIPGLGSNKVDVHKTVSPIILKNREYETVDYKDVARSWDGMAGTHIQFEGTIIQVMKSGEYIYMRIAQDGNLKEMYYVEFLESELDYNLLEDDYVLVKGTLDGIITYETIFNSQASLPSLTAEIIELIE